MKGEPVFSPIDAFRFEATYLASHFLIDEGRISLIPLLTLPVGTPTGATAAATATELAPTATAVTAGAATAFAGGGTQTPVTVCDIFAEGEACGEGDCEAAGVEPEVCGRVEESVGVAEGETSAVCAGVSEGEGEPDGVEVPSELGVGETWGETDAVDVGVGVSVGA
jgi:hypothetical protein